MIKKLFTLFALAAIATTGMQAQLIGTSASSMSNMASGDAACTRTIEGVPLPVMPKGKAPKVKRVSSIKPSGYIYGARIYSNVWSDYYRSGIYALSPDEPVSYSIYEGDLFQTSRGICYIDGRLWISHVERGFSIGDDNTVQTNNRVSHYVFNMSTGEVEVVINPGYPGSTGASMVYDRYTGKVYGCFANNTLNGNIFGILDMTTYRVTPIAELEVMLTGMVIDKNHRMWGMERKSGMLYEVDMQTGVLREVGKTGVTSAYMNSGCLDPITGVYYYNTCNLYESTLYAINTETATATPVYSFPTNDEWTAMWMLPQLSMGVPGAPTNVNAYFDGLEGEVNFKMPRNLADGTAIMGEQATYTVYVDGVEVATGEANYGASVSVPLTVERGGDFIVAVAVSNDQGESEVVRKTVTAGDASLPAPASVTLVKSGNNFKVTWNSVNVQGATYTVTRQPEGVVVATNMTDTTFTEPIPSGLHTNYFYSVVACLGNAQSQSTRSNYVASGQFSLPYSNKFETQDRANELTYINANNDAYVWTYAVNCDLRSHHGIYLPKNNRELTWLEKLQGVKPESDDWAITPGLPLETGKTYTITYILFGTYADMEDYRERYEVKMGTSPTVGAMTTTILSPTILTNDNVHPLTQTLTFTAPSTGTYYIGLHGISQGGFWFGCLGIEVSEGVPSTAPNMPKSMAVTPAADGSLTADVSVGLSSWNTLKQSIGALGRAELFANDQLVYTWDNPTPGSTVTATVDLPLDGEYEFKAIAYSTDGVAGIPRTATAYVGVRPPTPVSNATIEKTSTPGEVTMTWSPVTTNIDGTAIDGSKVTYTVYDEYERALTQNISETNFTHQAIDYNNDPQQFVRYYINSHFGSFNSSTSGFTPYIAIGKPYSLPFYETDPVGFKYAWLTGGDASFALLGDGEELQSADGDGTIMAFIGSAVDQTGTITSAYINVTGELPTLALSYAALKNSTNTLAVKVICDGVTTTLDNITLGQGATGDGFEWQEVEYLLEDFKGKVIQLQFTGTITSHAYVIFDKIKVTSIGGEVVTGDLNGDGQVDVTDVSLLIDVVLGKEVVLAEGAVTDLNGDGQVDVTDVSKIIDIVLGIQ